MEVPVGVPPVQGAVSGKAPGGSDTCTETLVVGLSVSLARSRPHPCTGVLRWAPQLQSERPCRGS